MKSAYIVKGDFDMSVDRASIKNGRAQIIGVRHTQQACEVAKELAVQGVECIELCGGFKEKDVRQLIEATDNKIPIGYAVRLKE